MLSKSLHGSLVQLCPNVHWEENGAYTGEIASDADRNRVRYVIVGHSERRQYWKLQLSTYD